MSRIHRGRLLTVLSSIALASFAVRAETRGNASRGESVIEIPVSPVAAGALTAAIRSPLHAQPRAGATPEQRSLALRGGDKNGGAENGGHQTRPRDQGDASDRGRYPGDLQYQGGPTLGTSVQHAIFVNPTTTCRPNTCWGDPIGFLRDLNQSDFIHVTDQYVGTRADDRYPVGNNYVVNYPVAPGQRLTDLDVEDIAYSAAIFSGQNGYGHMYHVFLPPGQDLCFSGTTICYSPDDWTTFSFCAYHGSVDVSGFGNVVYSAEPFQNVSGCNVRPNTPNGPLADATNNVLSHELFEAITNPDVWDSWFNLRNNGLYHEEIGDECSFLWFNPVAGFIDGFDPSDMRLNGKPYSIQPEYSNTGHVCAVGKAVND